MSSASENKINQDLCITPLNTNNKYDISKKYFKVVGRRKNVKYELDKELYNTFIVEYESIPNYLGKSGFLILEIQAENISEKIGERYILDKGIVKRIFTFKRFCKANPKFFELCKKKLNKLYLQSIFERNEKQLLRNMNKNIQCLFYIPATSYLCFAFYEEVHPWVNNDTKSSLRERFVDVLF